MSTCLFLLSAAIWAVGILTMALAVAGSERAARALPAIERMWQLTWFSWVVFYAPVWLRLAVLAAAAVAAVLAVITYRWTRCMDQR